MILSGKLDVDGMNVGRRDQWLVVSGGEELGMRGGIRGLEHVQGGGWWRCQGAR